MTPRGLGYHLTLRSHQVPIANQTAVSREQVSCLELPMQMPVEEVFWVIAGLHRIGRVELLLEWPLTRAGAAGAL